MEIVPQLITLGDVCIAVILAGIIGWEREASGKPLGLRTNMLIGGAAALIIELSDVMVHHYDMLAGGSFRFDPTNLMQALVVGVSFIGAGAILRDSNGSNKIHNLTTAATILFTAGVGVAVALKQYILAAGLTLLAVGINLIIRKIEERFINNDKKPDAEK